MECSFLALIAGTIMHMCIAVGRQSSIAATQHALGAAKESGIGCARARARKTDVVALWHAGAFEMVCTIEKRRVCEREIVVRVHLLRSC